MQENNEDEMQELIQEKGVKINLDESLFNGYLSETEDSVWVSAIESKKIGNGDFSRLIKQLKEKYKWIKIPTPSNMMIEIAEHLGFIKKEEWFGEPFNEMGVVMFWEVSDVI